MRSENTRSSGDMPPPHQARVWLDFDGTITRRDVLDDLIQLYAVDDSWKQIEERWQAGVIGSRECLAGEFDLIRINPPELAAFLHRVEIDPGLASLIKTLRDCHVPFAILSDGVERFIRAVLSREGFGDIPLRSNRIEHIDDRLTLRCPHADAHCQSGAAHCKCASAIALNPDHRRTIYVGDGRSDLCPARKADVVFAKGTLAALLGAEGIEFRPFETLADVAECLREAWVGQTQDATL